MFRKEVGALLLLCIIFSAVAVPAADVAYLALNEDYVKQEFIEVLDELSLSYELVFINEISGFDFSSVKLMLLNNDYFPNWRDIPVNEVSAVIVNGRHMDKWGWTRRVTTSSQDMPIEIKINISHELGQGFNETLRVYNTDVSNIYYLDNRDVFSGLEIIGSNIYDNRDAVIALARAGSNLTRAGFPSTEINADTLFFGITESEDWSEETRELFMRSIELVSIDCFDDNFCPEPIIETPYCFQGNAFQDIESFQCINAGASDSECLGNTMQILIEVCDTTEECSNGECVEIIIECEDDEDCGTDSWDENEMCQNGNVFDFYTSFNCVNPGTQESECVGESEFILKEECPISCNTGMCVECNEDNECPADFFTSNFCSSNNVLREFIDYSCVNNECISETFGEIVTMCSANDLCINGECNQIACFSNSDCGTNRFSGSKYCDASGNVKENFVSFMCSAPGTTNSFCSSYDLPILIEQCEFACSDGECVRCNENNDCDDNNDNTEDTCFFAGSENSFCENNSIVTCEDECSDEAMACIGNGTRTCHDYDGDGCTEWSSVAECGFNEQCVAGFCV